MKPIVAVVGRPNVGKSTLVNRLAQTSDAIVHESRGVTRDRSYHTADWNGREFTIVDTGGIEPLKSDDVFATSIRDQALAAAEEAAVILFVVDGRTGVTEEDESVARMLKRCDKPVFLLVNKLDNPDRENDSIWEFYSLGIGEPTPLSALHGHGTGDLLDDIVALLPEEEDEVADEFPDALNVAIIGRPNAGKSSLFNRILGADRSIVSNIAGTTRDVIEDTVTVGDIMLRLADTAGIRDTDDRVESIGVELAKRRIELADLVLAVFDITKPLDNDDKKLLELVKHKNTVVILNKSDMGNSADISAFAGFRTVVTSAVNGGGYEALCSTIADIAGTAGLDPESAVLINERQRACAERALNGINEAISALNDGNTVDAVGVCVDDALAALLELTGRRVTNEVSDEIFRKFCVGK